MTSAQLIVAALALPLAAALGAAFARRAGRARPALSIAGAALLAAAVLALAPRVWAGGVPQLFLLEPWPGLVIGMRLDRLGLALALVAAAAWLWRAVRAAAGPREALQAFALVVAAFAANVPTLVLSAVLLTGVRPARRAWLLAAGLVLAGAIAASLALGGSLEFFAGGLAPEATGLAWRAALGVAYAAGIAVWGVAPRIAWPRAAAAAYAVLKIGASLAGLHL